MQNKPPESDELKKAFVPHRKVVEGPESPKHKDGPDEGKWGTYTVDGYEVPAKTKSHVVTQEPSVPEIWTPPKQTPVPKFAPVKEDWTGPPEVVDDVKDAWTPPQDRPVPKHDDRGEQIRQIVALIREIRASAGSAPHNIEHCLDELDMIADGLDSEPEAKAPVRFPTFVPK